MTVRRGQVLLLPSAALTQEEIERHILHLNGIVERKALEAVIEVGQYALDHFYDGDIAAFRRRGGSSPSLDQILAYERPKLRMARTSLYEAIKISHQVKQFPQLVAYGLRSSHHRKLLKVRDDERRCALAEQAAHEHWTVERLEQEIGPAPDRSRGGRRGKPPITRILEELDVLLERTEEELALDDLVGDLSTSEMHQQFEGAKKKSALLAYRLRSRCACSNQRARSVGRAVREEDG